VRHIDTILVLQLPPQRRHVQRLKLDHSTALAAREVIMFCVGRRLKHFTMIILIKVTGFDETVGFEESQRPIDRGRINGSIALLCPRDNVLGRQMLVTAGDHLQDDAARLSHAPTPGGDCLFSLSDKFGLSHGILIASELQ
jgi:hypothetical protein